MRSWAQIIDDATAFRHELHRQPERTWQEHATAGRIRQRLDQAGIPWRICAETGTVADLAQDKPGPRVALRADIDALPILECSGVAYCSEMPGTMHACGHDGHTATLMAVAWWLRLHEDRLPHPVRLLFQPAEEGGHGAQRMVADGALDGVDRVYGWHNWPAMPFGTAACPDGPIMAANGDFIISLTGRGGHASQPEACADTALAAAAVTLALQQIVARRLPPQQAAVVSVGQLIADGGSTTIIPERATIAGSIRAGDTAARDRIGAMIGQIAEATAQGHGVRASTELRPRYNATINDATCAAHMRSALAAELGPDWQQQAVALPLTASEDFSYYLAERPGAYALLGADDGANHHHPCHSPQFDFNDRLIPVAARLALRLAGVDALP